LTVPIEHRALRSATGADFRRQPTYISRLEECMATLVRRASDWLGGRLRALVEWPCQSELATLRKQWREVEAVLDAVDDQIVLTDPSGRVRFANRALAAAVYDLTGVDAKDIVGKLPSELGLPDELQRVINEQRVRVNATRAAVTAEVALTLRNGLRWQEQKVSPVFHDGRISAHVMVGRDIDERKHAQRRLELLSKVSTLVGNVDLAELLPAITRLAIPELADWSVVDVCGDGLMRRLYVAQRDPDKVAVAAALQRFAPWPEHSTWRELIAGRPLLLPDVTDELLQANANDSEHLALLRQLRILSALAVPLRVRDKTVAVMTFATTVESGRRYGADDLALAEELARRATSIIDRARLHQELQASEARFRIALAASRSTVFEQDQELRYRWLHNFALDGDFIGKGHADVFSSEEAEQLTALKQRVLDSGEQLRTEVVLTFNGDRRVLREAIDPLRDDSGAIVGVIGAATDITDEKRVQEELERAVGFREKLMGILGHDLRNPLSAVLAGAGLLQRSQDLAPQARANVDRMVRAARRMAEMIRTLLDFTQVRFHGSLPVSPAPTDLAEVAQAIVDELRDAAPERTIDLAVRGDARGEWDSARLSEVLSNLVGNALAHGAASERVTVAVDGSADQVWLRVHNGGAPIAPEQQATLFEPFRRGAAEEGASRAPGLGLGLYIVRQIVLAHGGAVTVESTLACGTTFIVRLPRGRRAADSLPAAV
jgi:PAS domain S-box-containing protein